MIRKLKEKERKQKQRDNKKRKIIEDKEDLCSKRIMRELRNIKIKSHDEIVNMDDSVWPDNIRKFFDAIHYGPQFFCVCCL